MLFGYVPFRAHNQESGIGMFVAIFFEFELHYTTLFFLLMIWTLLFVVVLCYLLSYLFYHRAMRRSRGTLRGA
jgi:drug/metabolite transporter (DMT)-like permease